MIPFRKTSNDLYFNSGAESAPFNNFWFSYSIMWMDIFTYALYYLHIREKSLAANYFEQSLQIIYIIPVQYATRVAPFCYRNTISTNNTGTIQYHKVQDASTQRLKLPGISEQSFRETTRLLINWWFWGIYRVKKYLTHETSYVPDDVPLRSLFLWKNRNGANSAPFRSKINAWCQYGTICRKLVIKLRTYWFILQRVLHDVLCQQGYKCGLFTS